MLYTLSILHLTRSTPAIFLYTAIILIFPPYNIILQQAIHRVHSQSFGPTSREYWLDAFSYCYYMQT